MYAHIFINIYIHIQPVGVWCTCCSVLQFVNTGGDRFAGKIRSFISACKCACVFMYAYVYVSLNPCVSVSARVCVCMCVCVY